jgi:hypothetical protein
VTSYDRLMDDFGAELARAGERAEVRLARRRRLTVGGLALSACLAIALVLFGVGSGAGRRLDVVAQARAALSPPQRIVHLVVTTSLIEPAHTSSGPLTTEQWSAVDPSRWRMSLDDGRQQVSYARGVQRIYRAQDDTLNVYRGYKGVPSKAPGLFSNDPVAGLRAMLAAGRLRDTGEATVGGRAVRRLVGEQRVPKVKGTFVQRTTYDVDPQTFAPLGGTVEFVLAHRSGFTMRFHVDRYERLALDSENAKLLTIRTGATAKVVVHEIRRPR